MSSRSSGGSASRASFSSWPTPCASRAAGTFSARGAGARPTPSVAFCLDITAVDPVANGLLFERFLSDARVNGRAEPPDIDVDFEHERREEVLDYMYDNYDRKHAAITASRSASTPRPPCRTPCAPSATRRRRR